MRTRTHYSPALERRIVYGALWLFVACVIVIALTSCSPYAVQTSPMGELTATAAPSVTATRYSLLQVTPLPYWQLAAQGWEHIAAAIISGGKIGH
jgi:hypothetical protein